MAETDSSNDGAEHRPRGWLLEIGDTSGTQLWSRLAAVHRDPAAARASVKALMAGVQRHQRRRARALQLRDADVAVLDLHFQLRVNLHADRAGRGIFGVG